MANPKFMRMAIALSEKNVLQNKKTPFGAVVVRNGEVVGEAHNEVDAQNDPTAHAEIVAIRRACKNLGRVRLEDCELYTSCEPCPMCIGAIYWSGLERIYYANSKADAKAVGFSDQFIYEELERPLAERTLPMEQLLRDEAIAVFKTWSEQQNQALPEN